MRDLNEKLHLVTEDEMFFQGKMMRRLSRIHDSFSTINHMYWLRLDNLTDYAVDIKDLRYTRYEDLYNKIPKNFTKRK